MEIPQTDLIIDSLDAITKAYGGTPNDSNLIVDKLEDIYNNIEPAVSGNIEITENGENINVAPYATATVNVSGGGSSYTELEFTDNTTDEVYESVLTLSEIITASTSDLLGFMKTDTNLAGAIGPALNIPYVVTAIYENEDVPGTYDVIINAIEYMGINASGSPEIFIAEVPPTGHINLSYTK